MNKMLLRYSFILITLLILISCGKDNLVSVDLQDFTSDFDSVWTKFDENYPLFTYKDVDWTQAYIDYRSRFNNITLADRNDLLVELLKQFNDEHIIINTASGKYLPTYINLDIKINYNEYFMSEFLSSSSWHEENEYWGWMIIDSVGYLRFMTFSEGSIDTLIFDSVMEQLKLTHGLIIDLRGCIGGNLLLSEKIWNRFISTKIKVGSLLYRDGIGHNDYAEPIDVITEPRGNWQYLNTIVVLIGSYCGSGPEIVAETFSQFQHVLLIGEKTRGSVMAPRSYFLDDGTEYRVPIVAYLDIFDQPLEGVGVAPDILIPNDEIIYNTNNDILIDKAFELIQEKTHFKNKLRVNESRETIVDPLNMRNKLYHIPVTFH